MSVSVTTRSYQPGQVSAIHIGDTITILDELGEPIVSGPYDPEVFSIIQRELEIEATVAMRRT